MDLAILVLFGVYLSLYVFNMVIYGFLYSKNKNDIYKEVFGYWAVSLIVFMLGGAFQKHPLGVICSYGISIIPVFYFIKILSKKINFQFEFKKFSAIYCLVLFPLTILLFYKDFPIFSVAVPFTLGSIYLLGSFVYQVFKERKESLTFTQKFYLYGLVYAVIIQGLFPFSTLSPELSLIGWSLAFTIYVLFSIILPAFALESIHLDEERRLKELVDLRTRELRTTLKDKESLFKTIIHDINNPLNTIILSLETYQKVDSQKRVRIIERVNRNISIVGSVISNVTSKYMNMMDESLSICSLQECFNMSNDIFEDKLREKNITLKLICSEKSDFILNIDKITFVTSVLNNLVSNAIKFSFDNSEIHVLAKELNGEIVIEVKDYGAGMSQVKVQSLIANSIQSSTEGTSGETGLGLGFGQVKHYIESLDCSIELISKEHSKDDEASGTSVRMYFNKFKFSSTSSESVSTIQ